MNSIKIKRSLDRYLLDLIIVLETLHIGLSYYLPVSMIKNIFFAIIGISIFLPLMSKESVNISDNKKLNFLLLFVILVIAVVVHTIILRNNFVNGFIFISSVGLLYYLFYSGIDKKSMKLIIFANVILSVFHLIGSQDKSNYSNLLNDSLALCYNNPNMAGIVITSSILILVTGIFYVKKRFNKIFLLSFVIVDLYLLILTRNRGSILAVLVFIFLILAYRKKNKINKRIRTILILFPVIFAWAYTGLVQFFTQDVLFLEKPIYSGRQIEWSNLINKIIKAPFSTWKLPSGGLNLSVAGIIEYGIFGFSAYVIILLMMAPNIKNETNTRFKIIAFLAFLSIFIQQSFEATLNIGNYGIYVFNYLLLGISFSRSF